MNEYKVTSKNGALYSALEVFSASLSWLKDKIMSELNDQSNSEFENGDVKWVLTVPAIWCHQAKSFMREAAYKVIKAL